MEERLPTTIPQEFVLGSMLTSGVPSSGLFSLWSFGLVVLSGSSCYLSFSFVCASTSTTTVFGCVPSDQCSIYHPHLLFCLLSLISHSRVHLGSFSPSLYHPPPFMPVELADAFTVRLLPTPFSYFAEPCNMCVLLRMLWWCWELSFAMRGI